MRATRCPTPTEPIFRSIIGGLFAEHLMPTGSIVDVGANTGDDACFYAERQPQRLVHAIDPMRQNVDHIIRSFAAHLPNLRAEAGALGAERGWLDIRSLAVHATAAGLGAQLTRDTMKSSARSRQRRRAAGSVPIHTLDHLFMKGRWIGERLAFGHFDVEGNEMSLLQGAMGVIRRDRPVFTTEVFVHNRRALTRMVLRTVASLDYVALVIEEECGIPADCRNVLHLPRERLASFANSSTFELAAAALKLSIVNESSIASLVAPCCVPSGPCCRFGSVFNRKRARKVAPGAECCSHAAISRWRRFTARDGWGLWRLAPAPWENPWLRAPVPREWSLPPNITIP